MNTKCKKDEIQVLRGNPRILGVSKGKDGYHFAVVISEEKAASLLLYKKHSQEVVQKIALPVKERVGEVSAVYLKGFIPEQYDYNYQIGEEIFQDPRTAVLIGCEKFGKLKNPDMPHSIRCGCPEEEFDWKNTVAPKIPYTDMILYKLHVRGFTMQKNSKVHHKGTFLGLQEKIPYLKELGITAIELMPAYEFQEVMIPEEIPYTYTYKMGEPLKVNYWGYTPQAFYFAPKASYCATKNPIREYKEMVCALHQAGIECIMEFYFPTTANPLLVLEALRYWKSEYHVDGFHLIGDGVPTDLLMKDPLLAMTKLFFAGIDGEHLYHKETPHFKHLAEYNEAFCQNARRFLKGDEDMLSEFTYRIRRNPSTHGVINYMSIQDGLTLTDMVMYDMKHNEENGEDNRDGTNYNYSWNCGVEGPSRKLNIKTLRQQQLRNSFLFLFLSQGVPLLYQGDEFGNSQDGNNNAYCQDNEVGWVKWVPTKFNKDLLSFVKAAISFRKEHPVLHMPIEPKIMDYKSLGYPDLSYHSQRAWYAEFDNNFRHIGVMYNGNYACDEEGKADDTIYIAYNCHWNPHEFALPSLTEKKTWQIAIDTSSQETNGFYESGKEIEIQKERVIKVPPRTIVVLVGK